MEPNDRAKARLRAAFRRTDPRRLDRNDLCVIHNPKVSQCEKAGWFDIGWILVGIGLLAVSFIAGSIGKQ